MLSLLKGPIPIVGSTLLDVTVRVNSTPRGYWYDGFGLVFEATAASTFPTEMYVAQPDGTAIRIGRGWSYDGFQGWGWSAVDNAPAYAQDDATDSWHLTSWPHTGPVGSTHLYGPPRSFGVLANRKISAVTNRIESGAYDQQILTTEYTFTGWTGGTTSLHYAGRDATGELWWMFNHTTGGITQYNSTTMTEPANARTSVGSAAVIAGYSVKHRLWFVVRANGANTEDEIWIYATEPVANALSTPALAAAISKGGATTVSTVLTGAHGELISGRNVTFSTTHGTVSPATVATDASGVARTNYYGPLTTVTGGTLTATLVE